MSILSIIRQAALASMRRAWLAGLVVLLAGLVLASPANAAGWAVQPTPNSGDPQTLLNAVSCPSATACVAVGHALFQQGVINVDSGIDEAWNGASWNLSFGQKLSGNANNKFQSVSCASATSCEAVGNYTDSAGNVTALAEGWNGSSWTLQSVSPPSGALFTSFAGVSCTSASACVAVGDYEDSAHTVRPMFEGWDGTRWQLQPGFEARGTQLNAVACTDAFACLAVGTGIGTGGLYPFAERWNGTAWDSESPAMPSAASSHLTGVSCLNAVYCVAVWDYLGASGNLGFGELSTGVSKWSLLNTVNPSSQASPLTGVSCARGGGSFGFSCQAVGSEESGPGSFFAQAQVWNGLHWSYEIPAGTALETNDFLDAVSCASGFACTAVGDYQQQGSSSASTLAERFSGGSVPHGLSLGRHGQVLALLRQPRKLELLVFKLGRHGRLLGSVALGQRPKGRSRSRWNLRVAAHRLAPGTYTAELVAALARGATTDGPSVTFRLTYPASPVRVLSSTCSVAAATKGRC